MIELRAINRDLYAGAKRYWAAAIFIKLSMFGIGAWAIFFQTPPAYLPQLLLVLAVGSELVQLRSDGLKGQAERLLRALDICQSFGREVSEADKRDILLAVSRSRRRHLDVVSAPAYFDSQTAAGPTKAVENLIESAWYTRRQAAAMAAIYGLLIALFLSVAIAALVRAARTIAAPTLREQVVRAVTAWLLLIVSLNMLTSVWAYCKMYLSCQRTELVCQHLSKGSVSEVEALKQWHEYQIARAASPLLPAWLWHIMKASLDEAWRLARRPLGINVTD